MDHALRLWLLCMETSLQWSILLDTPATFLSHSCWRGLLCMETALKEHTTGYTHHFSYLHLMTRVAVLYMAASGFDFSESKHLNRKAIVFPWRLVAFYFGPHTIHSVRYIADSRSPVLSLPLI